MKHNAKLRFTLLGLCLAMVLALLPGSLLAAEEQVSSSAAPASSAAVSSSEVAPASSSAAAVSSSSVAPVSSSSAASVSSEAGPASSETVSSVASESAPEASSSEVSSSSLPEENMAPLAMPLAPAPMEIVLGTTPGYPNDNTGLTAAVNNIPDGGTIKLGSTDILLSNTLYVNRAISFTLDLQSSKIYGVNTSNSTAIEIDGTDVNLTITGTSASGITGGSSGSGAGGSAIELLNGRLVIEGGTYESGGSGTTREASIDVGNVPLFSRRVELKGGVFKGGGLGSQWPSIAGSNLIWRACDVLAFGLCPVAEDGTLIDETGLDDTSFLQTFTLAPFESKTVLSVEQAPVEIFESYIKSGKRPNGQRAVVANPEGYILTGTTTTNTVKSTEATKLVLQNLNITAPDPFFLETGTDVILEGVSTITSTNSSPAFSLVTGASVIIDGGESDTLNLIGNAVNGGPGLGGSNHGKITVRSGNLNAKGGPGSAGIGGSNAVPVTKADDIFLVGDATVNAVGGKGAPALGNAQGLGRVLVSGKTIAKAGEGSVAIGSPLVLGSAMTTANVLSDTSYGRANLAKDKLWVGNTQEKEVVNALIIPQAAVRRGDMGSWSKGSTTGHIFDFRSVGAEFKGLYINQDLVEASHYTVAASAIGTEVTIKPEYLETLPNGTYSVFLLSEKYGSFAMFNITGGSGVDHSLISGPNPSTPISLDVPLEISFKGDYQLKGMIRLNGHELTNTPNSDTSSTLSGYPGFAGVVGTTKSGSVIVTFTPEFLKFLPDGSYTLEVLFFDGAPGSTSFLIQRSAPNPAPNPTPNPTPKSPQTGDNGGGMGLWLALAGLSLLALAGGTLALRRKKATDKSK